uniref:Uncharacterized protein n=1 Tax=Podarcis muralis TaxID=64176 RepID=A0A670JBL2_PODMU
MDMQFAIRTNMLGVSLFFLIILHGYQQPPKQEGPIPDVPSFQPRQILDILKEQEEEEAVAM